METPNKDFFIENGVLKRYCKEHLPKISEDAY